MLIELAPASVPVAESSMEPFAVSVTVRLPEGGAERIAVFCTSRFWPTGMDRGVTRMSGSLTRALTELPEDGVV